MSGTEIQPGEQPVKEAAEPGERAEQAARLVLTLVAGLVLWGVLVAFPYLAYVVVGVLGTVGWQKGQAWLRARRSSEGEQPEEAPSPDVGEALRRLVGDDNGVLLTRLRDDLKVPDTKVVKRLLDAEGVPWKAVRTSAGNGPGVHKADIPPTPSPAVDAHDAGCCCRSGDNANTNNASPADGQKRLRVERIGAEGRIVYAPADTVRHHQVRGH
ncbi:MULTISPECIES: hypothetical protein [unclassified Streptomyces]|uniref:hypothetical protein n=1 Tax=unclassified Streptomyces TaxID=2593676 RepID=UPI0033AFF431